MSPRLKRHEIVSWNVLPTSVEAFCFSFSVTLSATLTSVKFMMKCLFKGRLALLFDVTLTF